MRPYSDPNVEAGLMAISGKQGFNDWLGFELLGAGNGQVELRLAAREDLKQHHGFFHGGVLAALADTACAWAAASAAGDVVTSTLNVQYIAPARGSHIRAHAEVVRVGKRNAAIEVRVYSENEDADAVLAVIGLASITVLGRS